MFKMTHQSDLDNLKFSYYNIHGYILAVSGQAIPIFDRELKEFKIKKKTPDLYIIETQEKNLPIQLRGSSKGIFLPFDNSKIARYESGADPSWLFGLIQNFIRWKDKTYLHCGAVSKDNKAVLFPASEDVGKTRTTLYLTSHGYDYLNDEWLILGQDGIAYPYLKSIHLFDYNLKDKNLAKKVLGNKRIFYNLIYSVLRLIPKLISHRYVKFACDRIKPQFSVRIDQIYPKIKFSKPSKIEKIFWLIKDKNAKKITIEDAIPEQIAEKMSYINVLEKYMFYRNYYDFAYHNQSNPFWENYIQENKNILTKAFKKAKIVKKIILPHYFNPAEIKKIIESY